jgi:hypothetical protein
MFWNLDAASELVDGQLGLGLGLNQIDLISMTWFTKNYIKYLNFNEKNYILKISNYDSKKLLKLWKKALWINEQELVNDKHK